MAVEHKIRRCAMKKHTIIILIALIFVVGVLLNAIIQYDPVANAVQAAPPHMGHVWGEYAR